MPIRVRRRALVSAFVVAAALVLVGVHVAPGSAAAGEAAPVWAGTPGAPTWVTTWAAAPVLGAGGPRGYVGYSIRNVLRVSVGGEALRVHLSNAFGTGPATIARVSVALAAGPATPRALPRTGRTLLFGGARQVTIPTGGEVVSDPVDLLVRDRADLLVSTYTPDPSGPVTYHPVARQRSFFARTGDRTLEESGRSYRHVTTGWHYVDAVDVFSTRARGTVVTFGDSITDGVGSTLDANARYPDALAARLLAAGTPLGIAEAGISGNRLLRNGSSGRTGVRGLARLGRDALARTGTRSLIVLEGINDIQLAPHQVDPAPIIDALRQVVGRAHTRGVRVTCGTLTPFQGWRSYSTTLERTRQAVNAAVRGGLCDAVADFDRALRQPGRPHRLRPAYDSGDHLHPSDAGYRAMAAAIDLARL